MLEVFESLRLLFDGQVLQLVPNLLFLIVFRLLLLRFFILDMDPVMFLLGLLFFLENCHLQLMHPFYFLVVFDFFDSLYHWQFFSIENFRAF